MNCSVQNPSNPSKSSECIHVVVDIIKSMNNQNKDEKMNDLRSFLFGGLKTIFECWDQDIEYVESKHLLNGE